MSRYCPEAHRLARARAPDPVFAAVDRAKVTRRASEDGWAAVPSHSGEEPYSPEVDRAMTCAEALTEAWGAALDAVLATLPTTPAGFAALATYAIEDAGLCGSTRDCLPYLRALTTFLFFRKGPDGGTFFYPVDIPADQLQVNVDCNPGTLRVEDIEGRVVWPAPDVREDG